MRKSATSVGQLLESRIGLYSIDNPKEYYIFTQMSSVRSSHGRPPKLSLAEHIQNRQSIQSFNAKRTTKTDNMPMAFLSTTCIRDLWFQPFMVILYMAFNL
jgi:hypothetical protein